MPTSLRADADAQTCCNLLTLKYLRPLGSVVEHSLHTRGVSSSNLLAGTILNREKGDHVTGRPFHFPVYALCLMRPRPNLLKNRVTTAAAVVRRLRVKPAIVVIQNQMLAFVAHDV